MKKFVLIILAMISIFTFVACKEDDVENNTSVIATFSDAEINQNSITVQLTVDDPEDEITGTIYARLYDADGNAVSSRTFTKSTTGDHALDAVTVTFAALGLEKSYQIDVEVTVGRDVIVVHEYVFQTIGVVHITTVQEFLDMGTYRGADYVLDNDLDFTGIDFITPFSNIYFSGTFDGQGHTLSNIDMKTSKSTTNPSANYYYIGVFGYVSSSAEIKNVTLDHVTIGSETEPQVLDNFARVGFLAGYVASSNVTIENVHVINSHMNIETSTDDYVIAGGLVGELKGELIGGTITDSSIEVTTLSPSDDGTFLTRLGGAVGFLQTDGVLQEVNVDVDVTYYLTGEFAEDDGLKAAVGGAIGDNNAINTSGSVTDIVVLGDVNVYVDILLDEGVTKGNYAIYVGGLIGQSYTKVTNGLFAGSITFDHESLDNDTVVNKKFYVGSLFGYYGVSRANDHLVWVNDGQEINVTAGSDVDLFLDAMIGSEPKTPAHVDGVTVAETVVLNTVNQGTSATVITDMTDYFTSDYLNDAYEALND